MEKALNVLIVVVTFFLIVYITINNMTSHGDEKPKVKIAMLILDKFDHAMIEYKRDIGNFPVSLNHLIDSKEANWLGPYMKEKELKDPWAKPYFYFLSLDGHSYYLYSLGLDGKYGSKDFKAMDIFSESSLKGLQEIHRFFIE